MKKFIFAVIALSLLVSSASFASAPVVNSNPYPIYANGVLTDIRGYNIDGSTVVTLRDLSKLGLVVTFDSVKKQINVSTKEVKTMDEASTTAAQTTNQNDTKLPDVTFENGASK